MKFNAQSYDKDAKPKKTLVVFASVSKGKKEALKFSGTLSTKNKLSDYFQQKVFAAGKGETLFVRECDCCDYANLLAVGLGDSKLADLESLRNAAASAYKKLASEKIKEASVLFDSIKSIAKNEGDVAQAIVEGFALADYKYDELKSGKKETTNKDFQLTIVSSKAPSAVVKKGVSTGQTISECVNFSRRLGDMPGNVLYPDSLAKFTVKEAKGTKLKVSVWDKARIKKEKMGGLHGVSLGSSADPRLVIMEYKGTAASKAPICFVGKGLTFDSGGISIKPSQAMDEMKYDMCGGANVIGAMLAIAKLGLKVNAVAYVPASENMSGASAIKPGDVLTARNGKTVEVLNTDAEGRLILMDALSYASEKKPQAIFSAATLTGAMVVALSNIHTGIFSNNDKLADKVKKAARQSGELVWQMPLHEEHSKDMKGTYADLSNLSSFRGAGSSTAAAFLNEFVEDIPYCHFDIAGSAWNTANRLSYSPKKGATGSMVRTFVEIAKLY